MNDTQHVHLAKDKFMVAAKSNWYKLQVNLDIEVNHI